MPAPEEDAIEQPVSPPAPEATVLSQAEIVEKAKGMIANASEIRNRLLETNTDADSLNYYEEKGRRSIERKRRAAEGTYTTSMSSQDGSSTVKLEQRLNKVREGSTARVIQLEFSPDTPLSGKLRKFVYDVFDNALVDSFDPKPLSDEQAARTQKTIISGLDKRLEWVEHQGDEFVDDEVNSVLGLETQRQATTERVGNEVADLLGDAGEAPEVNP